MSEKMDFIVKRKYNVRIVYEKPIKFLFLLCLIYCFFFELKIIICLF